MFNASNRTRDSRVEIIQGYPGFIPRGSVTPNIFLKPHKTPDHHHTIKSNWKSSEKPMDSSRQQTGSEILREFSKYKSNQMRKLQEETKRFDLKKVPDFLEDNFCR
jgi:hypothetical protein